MLRSYHSNRLERLADRLAGVLDRPLSDPLQPELIITQSRGMARWLTFALAERHGVAANLRFQLPAAFIWQLLSTALEAGEEGGSAYDRELLVWRLMRVLPGCLEHPAFAPLAGYLRGGDDELRLWQLCLRIADTFDQYLVYRPELILRWESGAEPDDWQARLWREVAAAAGGAPHRARLLHRFLAGGELSGERLPERITLFGIPGLPPPYLEVLARLAERTGVHLFLMNPCREYWGDIEPEKRIARLRERRGDDAPDYLTSGNPLLASLGRQGRDFIDALVARGPEEEALYAEPDTGRLLGAIQADILDLREPPEALPGDDSLQLHICHGPMREIEVLHDRLLDRFGRDPDLEPRDVVVMIPEIERYAPYIEAVFGAAEGRRHIPYGVADLSARAAHPIIQAFLNLLEVARGRFAASEVLSVLEVPAVLRRFGLDEAEFETARRWVAESGIRWGLDGEARAALDLPAGDENTWAFGLRRLLLGYAMGEGDTLYHGVAPLPAVEGLGAEALGQLCAFVEELAELGRRLGRRRTAAEWAELLGEAVDRFFRPDSEENEQLQLLRDALDSLVDRTDRAGFDRPFGLPVLSDLLQQGLAEPQGARHFLTGGVTFCGMVPMRSLPFRMVCLVGMNHDSFPRQSRPPGFDRIAADPRPGDRARRDEDRYLFLEALLSARDALYISYSGRGQRDNAPQLPSTVVSELLDYIGQFHGEKTLAALTVEHPLQPFSRRNFDGSAPELFSYATEWLPGVRARAAGGEGEAPFCDGQLAVPAAEGAIELAELVRFFRHPARHFFRERLGVRIEEHADLPEDEEPFDLGGLDRYRVRDELLAAALNGESPEARRDLLKARGSLPPGPFADLAFDETLPAVEALAERLHLCLEQPLPRLELAIAGNGWELAGWLEGLTGAGLVRYRVGTLRPADRIALWLEHLALCAAAPAGVPTVSRFVALDSEWVLPPVAAPLERLGGLIELYRQGQSQPLRCYPCTAHDYVAALRGGKGDPLRKAATRWYGSDFSPVPPEGADPYWAAATRGCDPLDDTFADLAESVFGPVLDAGGEP